MITCAECGGRATVAVSTQGRESVRGLNTTVYYAPGMAPAKAQRLCTEHGVHLMRSLLEVLT